jgi:hypothetical protein
VSDTLEDLRAAFTREYQFDALGGLKSRLIEAFGTAQYPVDAGLLLGGIMQRRGEWRSASLTHAHTLSLYPDCIDAAYEAAQTAIDAAMYGAAKQYLEHLAPRLEGLPERYLRGIWRTAGLVGLHDLAQRAFDLAAATGAASATPAIAHRIASALRNQQTATTKVISIGENCLPWMLANRWGLRQQPWRDDWFVPFNLAQTSTNWVAKIIADQAEHLTDPTLLRVHRTPEGVPYPQNPTYAFDFNHEQGMEWIDDDYALLRARYAPRTTALRAAFAGERRVFFHYTEHNGDLNAVVQALAAVNTDDNYRIVVVDVFEGDREHPVAFSDKLHYARIRRPRGDYIWYRPDDWDAPEGVLFEQTIQDVVLRAMA